MLKQQGIKNLNVVFLFTRLIKINIDTFRNYATNVSIFSSVTMDIKAERMQLMQKVGACHLFRECLAVREGVNDVQLDLKKIILKRDAQIAINFVNSIAHAPEPIINLIEDI